jgi:hypothetical protein
MSVVWRTVSVLVLLSGAIPASAQQPAAVIGAGVGVSCGKWLEDRRLDMPGIQNWALGFLSGVGVYGVDPVTGHKNPLNGMDADGVLYWLDNHCRADPTINFIEAVKAFADEHPR